MGWLGAVAKSVNDVMGDGLLDSIVPGLAVIP